MYTAINYQSSLDGMSIDIAAPLDFGMQIRKRPDRLPLRLTSPICGHSKYVLSVDYVQTDLYCANVNVNVNLPIYDSCQMPTGHFLWLEVVDEESYSKRFSVCQIAKLMN